MQTVAVDASWYPDNRPSTWACYCPATGTELAGLVADHEAISPTAAEATAICEAIRAFGDNLTVLSDCQPLQHMVATGKRLARCHPRLAETLQQAGNVTVSWRPRKDALIRVAHRIARMAAKHQPSLDFNRRELSLLTGLVSVLSPPNDANLDHRITQLAAFSRFLDAARRGETFKRSRYNGVLAGFLDELFVIKQAGALQPGHLQRLARRLQCP